LQANKKKERNATKGFVVHDGCSHLCL